MCSAMGKVIHIFPPAHQPSSEDREEGFRGPGLESSATTQCNHAVPATQEAVSNVVDLFTGLNNSGIKPSGPLGELKTYTKPPRRSPIRQIE